MKNKFGLFGLAAIITLSLAVSSNAFCQSGHGNVGDNRDGKPEIEKPHNGRYGDNSYNDGQRDLWDHKKESKGFKKQDRKDHGFNRDEKAHGKEFRKQDKPAKRLSKEERKDFRPENYGRHNGDQR